MAALAGFQPNIHPSKMLGYLLGVVSLLKKFFFFHLVGNFSVFMNELNAKDGKFW